MSLCSVKALTIVFRDSRGELATLLAGESEVFCFLAGGMKMAGDEPKSDGTGVGFCGVEGRDNPPGCALPIDVLAREEGVSWRI